MPIADPRWCVSQCVDPPMCGPIQIPENHLKVHMCDTCESMYCVDIFLQLFIVLVLISSEGHTCTCSVG